MKSQETLTVQAGTNASCNCRVRCVNNQIIISYSEYNRIQNETTTAATYNPMSLSEQE